jgi:UDP-3-O-[3-hydroxymyristoyl] N-acetylglucosamine deacetylase
MTRKTISKPASFEGLGLHRGTPSRVRFLPADGPTGLRFTGPGFAAPVPALLGAISGTVRGTNITSGGRTIHTVEHLLSAAAGLGIDDLDIELEGEEPPAADGSALPYARLLLEAGLAEKAGQDRRLLRLLRPVEFTLGRTRYRAAPAAGLTIKISYEYPHPLTPRQELELELTPESYLSGVAPARTFGFDHEIAQLKAAGLGLGGSLDNAVVITQKEILAKGGLRFPDEFVRHKLLDLMGDLALAGLPFEGLRLEAERPGHAGNVDFAKLLLQHSTEIT